VLAPSEVAKLTRKWRKRQRDCREWLAAKERGEGVSSESNMEAHRQVIRTLDQCIEEMREANAKLKKGTLC